MNSLTEAEIKQILHLQRDEGVQRLSRHFPWPEFCDDRRRFHQDFVYDVALLAANRGVSWIHVIRLAELARGLFPQLDGQNNVDDMLSLLRHVLCEHLPNMTPVHRHDLTQFLAATCITRRRLFQAVLRGAANTSIAQLHLEVHLPPTPCPLAQGADLHERETLTQLETGLVSTLQQKEEELRHLRAGPRISLEDFSVPEDRHLDTQSTLELIRVAVQASESQIVASLTQEASLLTEILQLKLQQEKALTTGGRHGAAPTNTGDARRSKVTPVKTKTGPKVSRNPV